MTCKEAAAFVMPFGKHGGRTLDEIAGNNTGLEYLDWIRGVRMEDGKSQDIDFALAAYLDDPAMRKELNDIGR